MKTFFAAVSAIGLLASTPAFANEVSTQVNVNANVVAACGLGDHKSGAESAAGWTQGDVELGAITGADGKLNTTPVSNRSFGNVWCNGPASVTIEVASLALDGDRAAAAPADSSSFANKFDLKITGDLGGNAFNNGGGTLALQSNGATNGTLAVGTAGAFETGLGRYSSFNLEVLNPGNVRPVAGAYRGFVKLTASIS